MDNNNIADQIVELFEKLLEDKDISIPCNDKQEETERQESNNTARLYGMEYWKLVDNIEAILNNSRQGV